MSTAALTDTTAHDLARRVSGGLEIILSRDPADGSISIELRHHAIDEPISFRVAPDRALDAFHHPFAYLERHL
jgi:hypothetical protein